MDYSHYDELAKAIEFVDGKPYWTSGPMGGLVAGYIAKGYRRISRTGKRILAHRLNFYMVYGYIPKILDHIDRDRDNNDINNLRGCTNAQNTLNSTRRSGCASSYRGVSVASSYASGKDRWRCESWASGKKVSLGYHSSELEAAEAYNEYTSKIDCEFVLLNDLG